jgi:response regulator RpfG family c-di-GMP phosphodiesterase
MIADRPYGTAMSIDAALGELAACAGTQFDPAVVEAFCAEIRATQRMSVS